jgi:hypothetical protein
LQAVEEDATGKIPTIQAYQHDGERETNGLSSHLVLLLTQTLYGRITVLRGSQPEGRRDGLYNGGTGSRAAAVMADEDVMYQYEGNLLRID